MRIIAGQLKGLAFASPHGRRTHPMSEKVRGALFNSLGDIAGLTALDAFAGSGALAFEALSRGAQQATLLEKDVPAQRAVAENIAALHVQRQAKLIRAAANAWLQTTDTAFDLVLLDPPYDDLQPQLLLKLARRAKTGGLVVVSLPPRTDWSPGEGYQLAADHDYGDARLVFYRRIS
jgi:16S rRNA (guanine966-N2)-methyltransferase